MSKNKITLAIILGMISFTIIPAQASNQVAFNVDSGISLTGVLTQVGNPTGNNYPLKGFAKNLPLVDVMRQITPNGWKVKKVKNAETILNENMITSWSGGENWVETLNKVVKNNPVNATIYWLEKEIVLSPVVLPKNMPVQLARNSIFELDKNEKTDLTYGGSQQPEFSVFEIASSSSVEKIKDPINENKNNTNSVFITSPEAIVTHTTPAIVSTPAPVIVAVPAPVIVAVPKPVIVAVPVTVIVDNPVPVVVKATEPVKLWNLEPGYTLKETLTKWGLKAGYQVVWYAENYMIDSPNVRVLTGDFDSEEGPIKQISIDYGPESEVNQPLAFEFLQNATLVVKNYRFEQAGISQSMK